MAKEELMTLEGSVDEVLPDGLFGVTLDNDHRLIAYTAGKMRRFRIRTVVGDRVHVEMTPYDLSKGRIVFRERDPGPGPRRAAQARLPALTPYDRKRRDRPAETVHTMTHPIQAAPARRTLSLFGSAPRPRDMNAIIPPAELRKLVAAMVD